MKLVRDKIPELHAAGELRPHSGAHRERQAFRRASPAEYALLLRMKLAEEAGEVLSAVHREHLLEELADAWQVLSTIAEDEGFKLAEVADRARVKEQQYGGFFEGWVLEEKVG